jgi:hypothetical protein
MADAVETPKPMLMATETVEDDQPVFFPPTQASKAEISRVMAEMGRRGGAIGGKRRAANMTEDERSLAATAAANARWAKSRNAS